MTLSKPRNFKCLGCGHKPGEDFSHTTGPCWCGCSRFLLAPRYMASMEAENERQLKRGEQEKAERLDELRKELMAGMPKRPWDL